MPNNNVYWWDPDKLIKDILWDDLIEASRFARGKLLDVGCGNKPYMSIFYPRVKEYIGIDNKGFKADIRQDFMKFSLEDSSFNTVLCTQVIEHVPEPSSLLERISELLKAGGYLILTAPLVGSLHEEPTDFYRFTEYSLKNLLKRNNFKVVYMKTEGNWLSSIAFLTCFYLEGTLNRYFLKYPKRASIMIIQLLFFLLSQLPDRLTKSKKCPMNYIVVARKQNEKV